MAISPARSMFQPRQLPGGAPISGSEREVTFWGSTERRSISVLQDSTGLAVSPALSVLSAGVDRTIGNVLFGGMYALASGSGRAVLYNERHERVWKSHQYGPYLILPLGDRVRLWGAGYMMRGRMDQRAYPDPFDILGIPVDVRGTTAIGGIKLVLFRAGSFDVGFTADVFQGIVSRTYPQFAEDQGEGGGQQTEEATERDGRLLHALENPRHRPLENLPFGRQRLSAVVGYQALRSRFKELRLAVELAGRRDVGIDRPSSQWPLPDNPGRGGVLVGGDVALRLSWSDSLNHISVSTAYMVQVFQHTGYTAAARAFSGTFRFGRVGPTTGPWLSVDPGFGVPGMQSQASFDDRALPVHREPEGWAIRSAGVTASASGTTSRCRSVRRCSRGAVERIAIPMRSPGGGRAGPSPSTRVSRSEQPAHFQEGFLMNAQRPVLARGLLAASCLAAGGLVLVALVVIGFRYQLYAVTQEGVPPAGTDSFADQFVYGELEPVRPSETYPRGSRPVFTDGRLPTVGICDPELEAALEAAGLESTVRNRDRYAVAIADVITAVGPELTGLPAGSFEFMLFPCRPRRGTVSIRFGALAPDLAPAACGASVVGADNRGEILIRAGDPASARRCLEPEPFRWTVAHEFGHTLGFHHTDRPGTLMYPMFVSSALERRGWVHPDERRLGRALYAMSGRSVGSGVER